MERRFRVLVSMELPSLTESWAKWKFAGDPTNRVRAGMGTMGGRSP